MYDLWTSSCVARQHHHHRHHDATALIGADDVGRWTTTRTAVDDDDGEGFHDARATVRSLFFCRFFVARELPRDSYTEDAKRRAWARTNE